MTVREDRVRYELEKKQRTLLCVTVYELIAHSIYTYSTIVTPNELLS